MGLGGGERRAGSRSTPTRAWARSYLGSKTARRADRPLTTESGGTATPQRGMMKIKPAAVAARSRLRPHDVLALDGLAARLPHQRVDRLAAAESAVGRTFDVDGEAVERLLRPPADLRFERMQYRPRSSSGRSRARPHSLNSPSVPFRSVTTVCTWQRESRSRSSAFFDCHIMPSSSSPSTRIGSTGVMRGEPSRRRLPSRIKPCTSMRSAPRAASFGEAAAKSVHFMASSARRRRRPQRRLTDLAADDREIDARSTISSSGTVRMSRDSTATSASLPGVERPFSLLFERGVGGAEGVRAQRLSRVIAARGRTVSPVPVRRVTDAWKLAIGSIVLDRHVGAVADDGAAVEQRPPHVGAALRALGAESLRAPTARPTCSGSPASTRSRRAARSGERRPGARCCACSMRQRRCRLPWRANVCS